MERRAGIFSVRTSGKTKALVLRNPPPIVITTPTSLIGESWSAKTQDEMVIVDTSLKMPAIESGTIPARCMMLVRGKRPSARLALVPGVLTAETYKYSLATIENANVPGKRMKPVVCTALNPTKNSLPKIFPQPSTAILTAANVDPITGVNQKMVAKGLVMPISLLCISN